MAERGVRARVRRIFRLPLRGAADARADADAELESFLASRVADLMARGLSEPTARAQAVERLGARSFDAARHQLHRSAARREHRMRLRQWFEGIGQDLRFGARQLARAPGVAAVAILSLGVGIGANAAIFAVVDAVLLRTLPVERPNELVAIGKTTAIDGHMTGSPRGDLLSYPMYRDLRRDDRLVTDLAASGTPGRIDVRVDAASGDEHPNGRFVSANYFSMLGVPAERGRTFGADEEPLGASPVVVISDGYWKRRFGGAANVIGRRLAVNGTVLTIVGVAARGFNGEIAERPTEIWLPIGMQPVIQPHASPIANRSTSWLLLLGRLAPGVTLDQARAELTARIRALLIANVSSPGEIAYLKHEPIVVSSGAQGFSAARVSFRAALVTLQVGVALLLLIVCTNLANLLVGRGLARQTEISVRVALGAGRARLTRQLMTESVVLAVLGTGCGLALGWWGSAAVARVAATGDSSAPVANGLDGRVLLFTLCVCAAATLIFGLAPALRASRADLASSMRAHARSVVASSGRRAARIPIGAWLVPVQVALCLVLLTGAALLTRSLRKLESADPGMDRDHLVLADIDANRVGIKGQRFLALANQLSAAVAAIPGVRAVAYSENGLFTARGSDATVTIPGFVGHTEEDNLMSYDLVGPGYVHAVGGRLLRGRDISASDAAKAPSVAVINESAAQFYFGSANPLGKAMYFDAGVPTTVVGVVADIRGASLTRPAEHLAYVPYAQEVDDEPTPFLSLVVRMNMDPALLVNDIRRTIAAAAPELPQADVTPVSTLAKSTIRDQRLLTTLAAAFGLSALFLALVGLYGVMSYAVTRRTAELGLRSALGAERGDVLRLVLGDGLRLVAVGFVVGVPTALVMGRVLGAQVHGLPGADPLSIGFAAGTIALCAFAAALVPALRASRVSPVLALAQE